MEAYSSLGPHEVPTLTDIQFDENEIDQIIQQMQFQNSLLSLGQISTYPVATHATRTESAMFHPSSAFSSQSTSFNSPLAPSLTASSLTESPVMPEYDFPAEMALLTDDEPQIAFPDLEMNFPLEWSTAVPSWADNELGCDIPALLWDQIHADVDFSQPQPEHAPSDAYTKASSPTVATAPVSTLTAVKTPSISTNNILTCPHCAQGPFPNQNKLRIHINKHTKPFRCTAPACDYAAAEKKSLQRHLLARSKYDEEHRAAAEQVELGRAARHRCPNTWCTYATIRDDNLKRHVSTCAAICDKA